LADSLDEVFPDGSGEMVAVDIPCRRCSYSLRGLRKDGRCPECGAAISISICGDRLRFAHPQWLQRVVRGLTLLFWGVFLSVLGSILAATMVRHDPLLSQIIVTLASVVGLAGTWQMTTPDPAGIGEGNGISARKVVRIAVLCGVASELLRLAVAGGGVSGNLHLLSMAFGLGAMAGEFAKLHYIGVLAGRIPDNALRNRAHFLKWALAGCYAFIVVVGLSAGLYVWAVTTGAGGAGSTPGSRSPGQSLAMASCATGLVVIAVLVLWVMTLVLISRLANAIKSEVVTATDLWEQATARGSLATAAKPDAIENERPYF